MQKDQSKRSSKQPSSTDTTYLTPKNKPDNEDPKGNKSGSPISKINDDKRTESSVAQTVLNKIVGTTWDFLSRTISSTFSDTPLARDSEKDESSHEEG